uniref:ADAMTS like 5 n=1 Tax=Pavo cristatus TaxID=9049 RepID=A0A8C9FM53_PAVCR
MAVMGRQDGLAPRAHPGGPHGSGCWWPWQALLLAWLSLGCGIGTTQVRVGGTGLLQPHIGPSPDCPLLPPRRSQPQREQCGALSPPPALGPAGRQPRVRGGRGGHGAPAPAPAGTALRSAPGGVCALLRRSLAQGTSGSTGSASSRAALAARCRSVPCSAPCMTTNPCRACRPGTAGCPSMEVSPRAWGHHRGPCCPHHWRPLLPSGSAAPNVCDLNCLAVGHNFYYTFGRVLDGTRCRPGSTDLCVGGRCLVGVHRDGTPSTGPCPCPDTTSLLPKSVGCDGILGTGTQPRVCSRCGGGQDGCLFVHRLFQDTEPFSGHFGYMNVTKIPAGATNIKVTDKSRNFLALMRSDGRYVLNGDWSIAWPGPYEAAGTQLLYTRSPDGTESLEAPGPTDEDLHVLVLLQEPNPGIEYEFWLPRGHPQHSMVDTSALRQPQPRGAGSPPPAELPLPTVPPRARRPITEPLPPRSPPGVRAAAGRCGRCRPPKGRSQRIQHFCQSDFVFRARILARRSVGQEMRYEVQVVTPYRHRFPMVPREYVWVPDTCGCPTLLGGHEYVLMARRHVNYEHTLNRILLQRDGYARPWSPREERTVRDAERHCAHPQ